MTQAAIPAGLPDWIADHLRRYLATDGADGHLYDVRAAGGKGAVPSLLLTTTGRKSGKELLLPLFYCETDSGGYAVIASKGGAPDHPAWYKNLEANPEVGVQILARRFRAKARTASGAERQKIWAEMADAYPPYIEYQNKTEREIPVVVLDPV